ncbi:carbohydrate ABC transporter permease [Thermanaerothrix daxensis]|uniref:carbohydrate ABC transporter permease n=1 Tax=Thermanaerothrix daxensis TaxID=869279 RepID=UPI0009FABE1F|nr:carbohydrate ABC transporter permease [Thermanaerothrix daxensis]
MSTSSRSLTYGKDFGLLYRLRLLLGGFVPHLILTSYSLLAVFPVVMILINSFKTRKAIFGEPFAFPNASTFSLIGYETVLSRSNFTQNFINSIVVTGVSLLFILLFGSMAAFALSEYNFRGNTLTALYLSIGIMIPIRLGTVSLLRLMVKLGLVNTLTGLILVYIAQGLPLTIFILSQFMRQVPKELKDAARIDGASEYRIYTMVLPLVRPALGAIGIFTMIPIWNDLWFPLVIAPSAKTATITLGVQQFLGQFVSDWNAVLSSLSLAMVPILILYVIFSQQMIRSITAGALK